MGAAVGESSRACVCGSGRAGTISARGSVSKESDPSQRGERNERVRLSDPHMPAAGEQDASEQRRRRLVPLFPWPDWSACTHRRTHSIRITSAFLRSPPCTLGLCARVIFVAAVSGRKTKRSMERNSATKHHHRTKTEERSDLPSKRDRSGFGAENPAGTEESRDWRRTRS